ncbi:MAG: tetratricopeptide repeat protein [Archangium sp.]
MKRVAWVVLVAMSCAKSWPRPERTMDWDHAFRACRSGDQRACYWRANSLRHSDLEAAIELYEKSCDANVGASCNELGFFAKDGTGLPKSGTAAMEYWKKSCAAGNDDGCDSLGTGWRDGVGGEKNAVEAAKAYALACEQLDEAGCTNLGRALMRGDGVARDAKRAIELWTRVCNGEDEAIYTSCRYLGDALVRGEAGTPRDVELGLKVLRRACRFGDENDCYVASLAMSEAGDSIEALRYLRASCTWGHAEGCARLAATLTAKNTADALEEAAAATQRACAKGFASACPADAGVTGP